MAVTVKSAKEIELMREAGRRLEIVHDEMAKIIRPGISTMEINEKGDKVIRELGCKPNFLHYGGFPASICVSVNEEVVHGIPKRDRILKEGDIVSLDAGLIYKGYHSDAARTHAVGQISPEAQKLLAENGRALPSRDSVRDYYYESTSEQEGLEDAIKKSIEIGMPYYVTKKYSEVSTVFNSGMDTVWAGEVSAEDAAKDIQAQVDMILQ